MSERPILFSGETVRAILDGRKTQTRRVVILPGSDRGPLYQPTQRANGMWGDSHCLPFRCPYGQPGDRLWVRETWGLHGYGNFTYWNRDSIKGRTADDLLASWELAYAADAESVYDHWRPSTHMPRWASRLTLEVTGVRVERLQAISEADAMAEGVRSQGAHVVISAETGIERALSGTHRGAFACLWDSIYAARGLGWAVDPWVWVVGYRVVEVRS